jgi:hypothetical protein
MEKVRILLKNSENVEGDLLVLDFSLAMEKVRILLKNSEHVEGDLFVSDYVGMMS